MQTKNTQFHYYTHTVPQKLDKISCRGNAIQIYNKLCTYITWARDQNSEMVIFHRINLMKSKIYGLPGYRAKKNGASPLLQ